MCSRCYLSSRLGGVGDFGSDGTNEAFWISILRLELLYGDHGLNGFLWLSSSSPVCLTLFVLPPSSFSAFALCVYFCAMQFLSCIRFRFRLRALVLALSGRRRLKSSALSSTL